MYLELVVNAVHTKDFTLLFKIVGDVFYIDFINSRTPGGSRMAFEAIRELSEGCSKLGGRFTNTEFKNNQQARGVRFTEDGDYSECLRSDIWA